MTIYASNYYPTCNYEKHASDQIPHFVDNKVSYKASLVQSLGASKGVILAALFAIPVLVVRIIAIAFSIFGTCGKDLSKKIHRTADKLCAILIMHNFNDLSVLFESRVLCRAKNLETKSSIWHDQGFKKSQEFFKNLTHQEYRKNGLWALTPPELEKLNTYSIKGVITNGICFGATLWAIKLLITNKISTEKELVQILSPFKNGFPAEATALQSLHEALIGCESELTEQEQEKILKEIEEAKQEFSLEIEQRKNDLKNRQNTLPPEEYIQLTLQILNEVKESIPRKIEALQNRVTQLHYYKYNTGRINHIAALINLKLNPNLGEDDQAFYTGITNDKAIQEKFNKLKDGYYMLRFRTSGSNGHCIVYIKKDFGSYFLDPNFGLIKCTPKDPSTQLCDLLQKHYKGKLMANKQRENFLEVFTFD